MMTNISDISVCMIVRNEERFLEQCLRSVQPIAKEIVIVDTGSTDKTLDIAQRFTDKIFRIKWENDFASARNYALSKASCPIILSIDADEELQNPEALIRIFQNNNENVGGWLINSISFASKSQGSGFDTFATKLLRIFRNDSDIRFEGIVHEQIHESVLKKGYQIKDTDIILVHYGYSLSPQEMQRKQLRNLELLQKAIQNEPENSYLLFQIAKTYLALNKLMDAENYIRKTLSLVNPKSSVRPQALNYGGIIAFRFGDFNLAIQRAKESLSIIPNQSFANFILGETYSALTQYDIALLHYFEMEKALSNPNAMALVVGDFFLPFEKLYFRIGRCLIGLNKPIDAEKYFRKGLDINPKDFDCIRGLANALIFQGKFSDSVLSLKSFKERNAEFATEIDNFISQIYDYEKKQKGFIEYTTTKFSQPETQNIPQFKTKSTAKPFISLSMIVKNEEKFLPGCLESVKDIADEIVIVDTGSTDRTREIAESYGAKIFDFAWQEDFSLARNEALKYCTGQWILYLDADERIVYPPAKELLEFLANADKTIGGFYCLIESEHYQMDGSTEVHRGGYPRIFRNLGYPKIKFIGRVHEQIAPSIFQNGLSIQFSNIKILHLGYNQGREVLESKIKRNYRMLIQHVKEEPLNGYAWYQLGQTLAQMSLATEAERAIRMAIQTKTLSKSVFAAAASTLAKMVGNKGKYEEALHWAEKSLEAAPDQIYALHLKAYALLYLERYEEAELVFYEVLNRLKQKKGIPLTGFDILIPEDIVIKGLRMTQQRIKPI